MQYIFEVLQLHKTNTTYLLWDYIMLQQTRYALF